MNCNERECEQSALITKITDMLTPDWKTGHRRRGVLDEVFAILMDWQVIDSDHGKEWVESRTQSRVAESRKE